MPELRWYWGYPAFLFVIFAVAGFEIYFFRRRGWLGGTVPSPKPDEDEKR
jgi:magnesium transporter